MGVHELIERSLQRPQDFVELNAPSSLIKKEIKLLRKLLARLADESAIAVKSKNEDDDDAE